MKKNTNINIDFELWLSVLPELKKRKVSFSEMVEEAMKDFLTRANKQNERIGYGKGCGTPDGKEASGCKDNEGSPSNSEPQTGGEGS